MPEKYIEKNGKEQEHLTLLELLQKSEFNYYNLQTGNDNISRISKDIDMGSMIEYFNYKKYL